MEHVRILRNGDRAVTLELGNEINEELNRKVTMVSRFVQQQGNDGVTDVIPTFRSLTVCYAPERISERRVRRLLRRAYRMCGQETEDAQRVVCIPVCYGGVYGPDLADVAALHGMTEQEIIDLHCGRDYRIYMLGFLPGFPYLGGMDERLVTPRLDSPRTKIPAGSVGIGGEQTGIYPMDSPGGWRLIGRTPVRLYDAGRKDSVPYRAGDSIRFEPVTSDLYQELAAQTAAGTYRFRILQ